MIDLVCVANSIRYAFDNTDLSDAPGFLPGFPSGCCGWVSWIIGHYLRFECNFDPVHVCGGRSATDGYENHEWIEIDGMIVDITSDQYHDNQEPVIVSKNSEWHKQWEIEVRSSVREITSYDLNSITGKRKASEIYEQLAVIVRDKCGT
jgi:hypothetical protein